MDIDEDALYVDVEQYVLRDLGLHVHRADLGGLAGLLVLRADTLEGSIFLEEADPPERQRFTLGHELKHILIDAQASSHDSWFVHKDPADQVGVGVGSTNGGLEVTADEFASEFLIATSPLQRLVGAAGVSVDAIAAAAEQFGVSVTAAVTKWVCTARGRCAFLEIREGQLYRFVASPGLCAMPSKQRWLEVHRPISPKTRAAALDRGEIDLGFGGPSVIVAREWFRGADAKQRIMEDVLDVATIGRRYTLVWFPEDFGPA